MKTAIVPLAEGFEEIEAVAIIDILRRAGVRVLVAGVGGMRVAGAHGIAIECDIGIDECGLADAIVLPGGLPGTTNLGASRTVMSLIETVARSGGMVAAICAAPTVLHQAGVLRGRKATSHPGHAAQMTDCEYVEDRVVVDGPVITSRGAGTAIEFAAQLVRALVGDSAAESILDAILAPGSVT